MNGGHGETSFTEDPGQFAHADGNVAVFVHDAIHRWWNGARCAWRVCRPADSEDLADLAERQPAACARWMNATRSIVMGG
jgi:hypothetical protein